MNGKRRCENEYVNTVKAEFGKTEDPVMTGNFEPGHSSFDTSVVTKNCGVTCVTSKIRERVNFVWNLLVYLISAVSS